MSEVVSKNNTHIIKTSSAPSNVSGEWFDAAYWQRENKIVGQSVGRSTTYFFEESKQRYVLRHYFRGGLVQKISREHYIYTGLENTRAYRELMLLEKLNKLDLPSPRAIASRVIRRGLLYTNDIIMAQIPNAQDLYHTLLERNVTEVLWSKIGSCIASFHRQGVFHADLNIHNIMIDSEHKVWLIDFDRGEVRAPSAKWQGANMNRLLVSFRKEKSKHENLNWNESDWALLYDSYKKGL